jgi:hypothetical protein
MQSSLYFFHTVNMLQTPASVLPISVKCRQYLTLLQQVPLKQASLLSTRLPYWIIHEVLITLDTYWDFWLTDGWQKLIVLYFLKDSTYITYIVSLLACFNRQHASWWGIFKSIAQNKVHVKAIKYRHIVSWPLHMLKIAYYKRDSDNRVVAV